MALKLLAALESEGVLKDRDGGKEVGGGRGRGERWRGGGKFSEARGHVNLGKM